MKRGGPQRGRLLATAGSPSSSLLVFDTPLGLWNIYPPLRAPPQTAAGTVLSLCLWLPVAGGAELQGRDGSWQVPLPRHQESFLFSTWFVWQQDVSPASVGFISFKSSCSNKLTSIFLFHHEIYLHSSSCRPYTELHWHST